MKINEILTEQQGVAEGRYFKTSYGWAGGSKPSGGTYKHPEQIKADREAKKKAKEKQKNKPQGVAEGPEKRFMIYFVVPDVEDYDDHHEPEERTIIVASNRSEAIKKFQAEIPGAYIKDIYPMEGQQGVSEGSEQLWMVSFTDGEDIIKVRASSQQEAIFRATQIAKSKGNPYPSVDWAKPKEQGVAEGFTADDTNDYYADYYTDLLSQIRNMSWTDRATTKANVKRDLDSGRIKLPDLKLEIRNLDREIRAKQGVSEGQKR